MSNNTRSGLLQSATPATLQPMQKRKTDERILRTRQRLGSAMIELILEKPIGEVTVQQVLNRASVGRSTFYLHYCDKNDLLLSQLEEFLEIMSTMLARRNERSHRVLPVEEMFAHIGTGNKLYRTLAHSGHLQDFFNLAQDYFARSIEQRLKASGRLSQLSQVELSIQASALAGSVISLLQWWVDHDGPKTPREMDEIYHRMVWNGLG
jgi:AcrR family transcriptional regulator